MFERIRPYRAADVAVTIATTPWERAGYWALRQQVFLHEQRLFIGSDRDQHDASAFPLVATSLMLGIGAEIVGAVRIYETEDRVWFGGRLCVARHYRGTPTAERLIRDAVGTARALGCDAFYANVQERNVGLFERLHWSALRAEEIAGQPHVLMRAMLWAYNPNESLAIACRPPRRLRKL
jgi:putative N-acetyltransferase (TIGR04045 family)